jgi:hypothetical protein
VIYIITTTPSMGTQVLDEEGKVDHPEIREVFP